MKTTLRVSGVLFVLLAAACSRPHSTLEQADAALDLISAEALKAHVEYLADDARMGREAGEPGYDDAARYVADQFAALGLEPAGDDGWYQQVELRSYKVDTESAKVTIHRDGVDTPLVYREEFGMSGDPVRESTSVRAEVVYVGHGVHAPEHGYSDYDGVDVEGKIVAAFSNAPEIINNEERAFHASGKRKRQLAVERGAIGWISLRSRSSEERYPWARLKERMGKRFAMTWVGGDGAAANFYPELLGAATISMEASEALFGLTPLSFEEALEANENGEVASVNLGVEVSLSRRSEHKTVTSPNVLGLIRGTGPDFANEYIVYTAHLDHVGVRDDHGSHDHGDSEIAEEEDIDDESGPKDSLYNGAYDNAMGVALMLETARALVEAPPKRSVLFIALTAEEKGLLGSDYFANYPTVPADSLVANINLDMPLFIFPPADLVAFGSERSSLQPLVESAAQDEGFSLTPDPLPEENLFVRSDQISFVRKGVPAVYLIPGFTSTNEDEDGEALFRDHLKNHYHEPSDDLSRPVHWDSARRFARANARIGFAVGQADERPEWNEGDFFGERFGR